LKVKNAYLILFSGLLIISMALLISTILSFKIDIMFSALAHFYYPLKEMIYALTSKDLTKNYPPD
jgi:hypothetical protein